MDEFPDKPDKPASQPRSSSRRSAGRSAASLTDHPPGLPLGSSIVIALVVLALLPFLFVPACLLLGWGTQAALGHMTGAMHLASAVKAVSPDGKIRFEADRDGPARLVEIATGRVLYTRHISTKEYKDATARWQDNRQVLIRCSARYVAMVPEYWDSYLWDRTSGAWTDKEGKTLNTE